MGLCNELELTLRKAQEDSEKLMETVKRFPGQENYFSGWHADSSLAW